MRVGWVFFAFFFLFFPKWFLLLLYVYCKNDQAHVLAHIPCHQLLLPTAAYHPCLLSPHPLVQINIANERLATMRTEERLKRSMRIVSSLLAFLIIKHKICSKPHKTVCSCLHCTWHLYSSHHSKDAIQKIKFTSSSCTEARLYKNLELSAQVLASLSPYITFLCRVWEAGKCCHGLMHLRNCSVLSVTQQLACVMTCMLPCLQHSSMPSAFSSHPLQRPLRTPLEDQKFKVFYHFLNALALEIQEWSWKVSLESISINAAETTLEDFYLELHSLSSLFYRRASLSFFFSIYCKLWVKGGLTALRLKVYEDRALHTSQIKLVFK